MKVYISGAITGTKDYMKRFSEAEEDLTRLGYEVINPAKANATLPKGTTHDEYMEMSFCMLDMCDAIYFLEGWENSLGANMEYGFARAKKLHILHY